MPASFRGVGGLVVIGVTNLLLLGAVVGVILVGVDSFVRDQILKNAPSFNPGPQSQLPPGATPTAA